MSGLLSALLLKFHLYYELDLMFCRRTAVCRCFRRNWSRIRRNSNHWRCPRYLQIDEETLQCVVIEVFSVNHCFFSAGISMNGRISVVCIRFAVFEATSDATERAFSSLELAQDFDYAI